MEKVYRTVIIDDEESAIDNLCFELQRYSCNHSIFRLDTHVP